MESMESRGDIIIHRSFLLKFHLARHVTSRHDTTRSTCRARAFWLCRASRTARLDTLVSTRSTHRTCRAETWRDEPSRIWALQHLSNVRASFVDRTVICTVHDAVLHWRCIADCLTSSYSRSSTRHRCHRQRDRYLESFAIRMYDEMDTAVRRG